MNKKILIIDDEKSIREILAISLADEWSVFLAASGFEGLEISKRERPDLILLDRMMPGLDGFATLEKLRNEESSCHIPVIFLTAKVQSQDMHEYFAKDVLGVMSKPFDPMTIGEDIQRMLEATSGR